MPPQHTPSPAVELPQLPPALIGQDIAEEFLSAVGWGLVRGDERAREALDLDGRAFWDLALQGLWAAIQIQARRGEFTWGLVRQRLLEGGMKPDGWQNSVLVHQVATANGYVTLAHIPSLRKKLEELIERREAWDRACSLLEDEGVSQW